MQLFFDARDVAYARQHRSRHIDWLRDLGAIAIQQAPEDAEGFLFTGARSMEDYRHLVARHPRLRDRPEDRAPLLRLDTVLDALADAGVDVPTPRTWRLALDDPPPPDLRFPLFVRTASTSWKLGGDISRVRSWKQLCDEADALRRATEWDAVILAREWLDLAPAGSSVYGPVPQEIRVWIVDGVPTAWSFHHMNVVREPLGFPPLPGDLRTLYSLAEQIGRAFRSRLVVADFARLKSGGWVFIEAGPGSCAGTGHERVYKAVLRRLFDDMAALTSDPLGGTFPVGLMID
ncbi:MAG TPA: ATP-grasp domain-containing protein [Tepidisphaeraceae bacterium]|jgi:hypothetical protein